MPASVTAPSALIHGQPETVIDKTVTDGARGAQLLHIRVMRFMRSADSLVIEMQSDVRFCDHFKQERSRQSIGEFKLGGVSVIESRNDFRLVSGRRFIFNASDTIQRDGMQNFALFMAKDLSRGVTYKFTGIPMSAEGLRGWAVNMKNSVKEIYEQFLKPVDVTVELHAKVKELA